jgi:hypothetical protein
MVRSSRRVEEEVRGDREVGGRRRWKDEETESSIEVGKERIDWVKPQPRRQQEPAGAQQGSDRLWW